MRKDKMMTKAREVDKQVGKRIRARRRLMDLTQAEVAKALGISFQQLQKYETGHNRISAGRLSQLAELFSAPVGYFFGEETEGSSPLRAANRTEGRVLRSMRKMTQDEVQIVVNLAKTMTKGRD